MLLLLWCRLNKKKKEKTKTKVRRESWKMREVEREGGELTFAAGARMQSKLVPESHV